MSKKYSKHDTLRYIFFLKTDNGKKRIKENIDFTLREVGEGIKETGGTPPTSWSNFVLDLTRKNKGIEARLPEEIIAYGYDLRKKTGPVPNSDDNYCGTFVYRGFDSTGKTIPISDWLVWRKPDRVIEIDSSSIPSIVEKFISNDEASLFSVIDYCDIFTQVFGHKVFRVQSPMKWQPNEIDGIYVGEDENSVFVYLVEAKAISTDDDINLVQMFGQYKMFIQKHPYHGGDKKLIVKPIAAKMRHEGAMFAVLIPNEEYDIENNLSSDMFVVDEIVHIKLNPTIENWQ